METITQSTTGHNAEVNRLWGAKHQQTQLLSQFLNLWLKEYLRGRISKTVKAKIHVCYETVFLNQQTYLGGSRRISWGPSPRHKGTGKAGGRRRVSRSLEWAPDWSSNSEESALKLYTQKLIKWTQQVAFIYVCIHTHIYECKNNNQRQWVYQLEMVERSE